jgi:large subunit ribosomal protein L21
MEYAVIKTGGKQYKVSPGDVLRVEKLDGEPGAELAFTEVLMTAHDDAVQVGTPTVAGARVTAQVLRQGRAKKILVFKKKRRKNYRRKNGHRQLLTMLRITEILTDGKKPSQTKVARPEPKKAKPKTPKAAAEAEPKAKPAKKPLAKKAAPAKKPAAKPAAKAADKKPAAKLKKT